MEVDTDHGGIHNGPPWDQWDVQEWNKQLLRFCFVADADAPADQFLRAAEEDLLELTGDHESEPRAMAEKLVEALKWQAERRNRKPADFVLKHQMKKYTPSALEVPPFFAFLWDLHALVPKLKIHQSSLISLNYQAFASSGNICSSSMNMMPLRKCLPEKRLKAKKVNKCYRELACQVRHP